jgi:hypothetical protein
MRAGFIRRKFGFIAGVQVGGASDVVVADLASENGGGPVVLNAGDREGNSLNPAQTA